MTRKPWGARAGVLAVCTLLVGCAAEPRSVTKKSETPPAPPLDQPTTADTPIGLALMIENGEGIPLTVRAGQTFYLDQLDIRVTARPGPEHENGDLALKALTTQSALAGLDWDDLERIEEDPNLLGDPIEGHTMRRFYRGAKWMKRNSSFSLQQVDAAGSPLGAPLVVRTGAETDRADDDSFFIRRIRALHLTFGCPESHDCDGASEFLEEALIELRHARDISNQLTLEPATAALQVTWSLLPDQPWTVPITQVASPPYDYGFQIDLDPVTPPQADGSYAPGTILVFQLTLRDGAGNRLHPDGTLPTYREANYGPNEAGIWYYRGFDEQLATYWRRKHLERNFIAQIIGPAHQVQPIRSVFPLTGFFTPDGNARVGTIERDGVYADVHVFPNPEMFLGAWDLPVSDRFTFTLPTDAPPGTYTVSVKARRAYMGQDVPAFTDLEIQVGDPQPTEPVLTTGPCTSCHSGGGQLDRILHGTENRGVCAGCHAPLEFELEGPIYVRTHFIHSRSQRVNLPEDARCSSCHLTQESIGRTSMSACLSCHTSWPQDEFHTGTYGPRTHIYVGGDGQEAFQACTDSCHRTHPGDGWGGR